VGETQRASEIFLHIGTMKSGTTFIQMGLKRNRQALRQEGVYIPRRFLRAAIDVLGRSSRIRNWREPGAWDTFQLRANRFQGSVVGSMEFLCEAEPAIVERIANAFPDRQVHALVTCRDLLRVVPSHWQTIIKNGGTVPFADYVEQVLRSPDDERGQSRYNKGFWLHHDVVPMIETWGRVLGRHNVTVITVPPSGTAPDVLWSRFCTATGIDPEQFDYERSKRSNVSLTYAETEMLRKVNLKLRKKMSADGYHQIVNRYIANKLLRHDLAVGGADDRPQLGARSHAAIRARADAMIEGIAASEVNVIGDLGDLRIPAFEGSAESLDTLGPTEQIPDVISDALAHIALRLHRNARTIETLRRAQRRAERAKKREETG
jgi:hypothetical protein